MAVYRLFCTKLWAPSREIPAGPFGPDWPLALRSVPATGASGTRSGLVPKVPATWLRVAIAPKRYD